MLAPSPLESLQARLKRAVNAFQIDTLGQFGDPTAVEAASKKAERVFQGFTKAKPSEKDAYAAALTFMRGQRLEDWQYDQVGSALCVVIKEQRSTRLIGHTRFSELLAHYAQEASRGDLWRLTWYGLLNSYFSFPVASASEADKKGWQLLRDLLKRTWPAIDKQHITGPVPDWIRVVRFDKELLGERAAKNYGQAYLDGNTSAVEKLVEDLGIPQTSWFHHQIVLEALRAATEAKTDVQFKLLIPKLISLVETLPAFRDEAVELLLKRFHRCADKSVHAQLRDFVVRKDVWRNPKLKSAGIATAWNRVPESVWKMVLGWINEGNLKDFFDILAARNSADHGRLAFWSKYLKQISWTRLVFGQLTLQLALSNQQIGQLIAREEDSYATLTSNQGVDAFMMQIGNYIVVEFTKTPNAAYVYPADKLQFEPYARTYGGGAGDLKIGFQSNAAALRITHQLGWEQGAELDLKRLSIYPDIAKRQGAADDTRPATSPRTASTGSNQQGSATSRAPKNALFTMSALRDCVIEYGARIVDYRGDKGGRLWVEERNQSLELSNKLQAWGFRWAEKRQAWYFPE